MTDERIEPTYEWRVNFRTEKPLTFEQIGTIDSGFVALGIPATITSATLIEQPERVEPTKEWLDALRNRMVSAFLRYRSVCTVLDNWNSLAEQEAQQLIDAILASQPERVECPTNHCNDSGYPWGIGENRGTPSMPDYYDGYGFNYCPDCGRSLKGAGDK